MKRETKLRHWRKKNGFTVTEAARVLECSIGYYSEMERGIKKPSLDKAIYIEQKTLGFVTPYDFAA